MNIEFTPSQLRIARRSDALCRLVEEMAPDDFIGELRVVHRFLDEPLRLVLIASGGPPVSIELPVSWLYSERPEDEMREPLYQLFGGLPVLAGA